MPVVTLRDESKRQGDFYVPRYEIKIAGASLPKNVLRDVLQVTYTDSVKELDNFELTVNNWDAEKRQFKYVGSETTDSLAKNPLHQLFNPSRHDVELAMGYAKDLTLMMKGNFTTMEPNFPSSGGPTLTLRGLNVLHKLRTKQFTYAWPPNKRESEIAKSLETLTDPGEKGKKRFPLPVEIDENALSKEHPITYVAQDSQYDIDFLLSRARRIGYVIFIKEEEREKGHVTKPRRLYFGPSDANHPGLRLVTFELKWGISLIDFNPTFTTANQIKSVTVNGWNRSTKQPITGKASLDDTEFKLNRDLHKQLETSDVREERVVDEPVFTQRQADERAGAILLDRSKDLVKASGTCVGLPDLRAGQRVKIAGLGARFSGEYFVTDTTHTINDSGYITKFNGRREDPGK
jgi:Bacteriophage probable baseplate hub protein